MKSIACTQANFILFKTHKIFEICIYQFILTNGLSLVYERENVEASVYSSLSYNLHSINDTSWLENSAFKVSFPLIVSLHL